MLKTITEIIKNLFPALHIGNEPTVKSAGTQTMTQSPKKPTVKWINDDQYRKYLQSQRQERITPEAIRYLEPNEVFVFGTDIEGTHSWGASRCAATHFGAIVGKAEGPQGHCYAIPTALPEPSDIKPYVDRFVLYARKHPEKLFLVLPVGCGAAGHTPEEMAPLFIEASDVKNICLPELFWMVLNQ